MASMVRAQQVYDYVREQIISKELFPGNRVPEEELATVMQTSRTVVRNAITRLNYEGFVNVIPNCGAFVAKPTLIDMQHVYATRQILEVGAVRLAVHKISDAALKRMEKQLVLQRDMESRYSMSKYVDINRSFHWEIINATENQYIAKYLHELFNKTSIFLTFYDSTGGDSGSLATHGNLLSALKARDEEAAVKAVIEDIECAVECVSII